MSIGMHTLIFLFSVNIAFDLRILECTYVRFIWFVEVCLSRKGNGNEISSDKQIKKSLRWFDYLTLMAEISNCKAKANDISCPLSTGMSLHLNIRVAHSFQKYDLVITYEISYPKMEQIIAELLLFLTDNQHHIKASIDMKKRCSALMVRHNLRRGYPS